MKGNRRTPILVGVGDIKNKTSNAIEPMRLMLHAINEAIGDTRLSSSSARALQSKIDSIEVVGCWTWPYPDLPGLIAQNLGVVPTHKTYTPHGGNQPAKLLDEAAKRISLGETGVAIITGGEALASLGECAKANKLPPPGWTELEQKVESVFSPTTRKLQESIGATHSIGNPIQVYPLYENAFRAFRGQSFRENNKESASLYADFAKIAEHNEVAWNYGQPAETEESIGTITQRNRMICLPYPLLMNAFNAVNLAAACLLTSVEYAEEIGIPRSQWIYPLGGAGTQDSNHFWHRPNFYTSPSISRSLDACLEISGISKDQIDLFDFYSCFPIVPKIACYHLGIPFLGSRRPTSVLGGLTSFGGAGNNYSMHAINAIARELRKGNGRNGLILANGGVLTYQHVICISSQPRKDDYPVQQPLPETLTDIPAPHVEEQAEGEAQIESYTVDFNRDGSLHTGHVVGRLRRNNHRFLANHGDAATLQQLASDNEEQIGKFGWVSKDLENPQRNIFTFQGRSKI